LVACDEIRKSMCAAINNKNVIENR